jgi:hypothetical protein
MTKVCPKCRQEKPATTEYFNRCKHARDGLQSWCKECKKKDHLEHKEARNLRARERYRAMHPKEEIPEGFKKCSNCKQLKPATTEYFGKASKNKDGLKHRCKECRSKLEYQLNAEAIKSKRKKYYQNNKEKILEITSQYKQENAEWYKKYYQSYYKENADKIKLNVKNYRRKRAQEDINFRLLIRYRTRLYKALKGICKSLRTTELIGCSIEELKRHLEKQFKDGMSWNNYGEWHVDHIIPCAMFDLTNEEELRKCFHYTNLQPLWAEENIRKSSKYIL